MSNNSKFDTAVDTLTSMCIAQKTGKGISKECFVSNLRLFADSMEKAMRSENSNGAIEPHPKGGCKE